MGLASKLTSLLFIGAITGGVGYAGGTFLAPEATAGAEATPSGRSTVSAGQFTVPVFEGTAVAYVLLAQLHIEVATPEQGATLSRSRPRLRSVILETLFALERRGEIAPQTLDPQTVAAAVKVDLERSFDVGEVSAVLIERLLLQENGRARPNGG